MHSGNDEREVLIAAGWRDNVSKQAVSHTSVRSQSPNPATLSLFFAILCVIDLFGVFPIVALPKSIISCGKRPSLSTGV
jgi:hypothetical protein